MQTNSRPMPETPRVQGRGLAFPLYRVLFGAFAADLGLVLARLAYPGLLTGSHPVPEAALLILGVGATMAAFSRELPAQNLTLVFVVISVLSVAADLIGSRLMLGSSFASTISGFSLCVSPLIRVFGILNSRGAARWLLRPKRQAPGYGLSLLGFTAALAACFEVNLGSVAGILGGGSGLQLPATYIGWSGPTGPGLIWKLFTVFGIVACVTPPLIDKRPARIERHPPDRAAFWVWFSVNLLFLAAAAVEGKWVAAGLVALQLGIIAVVMKYN